MKLYGLQKIKVILGFMLALPLVSLATEPCQVEVVITDDNIESFIDGFTVPENTTYRWSCSAKNQVRGPIKFSGQSSALVLQSALWMEEQGRLFDMRGLTTGGGSVFTQGHKIYQPFVLSDAAASPYRDIKGCASDSFTIPADTTFVYQKGNKAPFRGTITFAANSSALELEADLQFAATGSLQINGDYAQIYGEGHALKLSADLVLLKPLKIQSSLRIDGHGHTLDATACCPVFDLTSASPLHLSCLKLKVNGAINSSGYDATPYLFFGANAPVCLHDVTIASVTNFMQGAILFYDTPVAMSGSVTILATDVLRMLMGQYAAVTLSDKTTLTLGGTPDLNAYIVGWPIFDLALYDYDGVTTAPFPFVMPESATLKLDGSVYFAQFFLGKHGLRMDSGLLLYAGAVQLFNTDFIHAVENSDLSQAVVLDSGLKQKFDVGATVMVPDAGGMVITVIDDANFAAKAAKGFTIPDGMIFQWRCSPDKLVQGPISAGSESHLWLSSDLYLGCEGQNNIPNNKMLLNDGALISGDFAIKMKIDTTQAKKMVNGFTVPDNTIYYWNAPDVAIDGQVLFSGNGEFILESDLHLGENGSITDIYALEPNFLASGHTLFDSTGAAIVIGINSENFDTYRYGFHIPSRVICQWDCLPSDELLGDIVFADQSSTLYLVSDLHTGINGGFKAVNLIATIYSHNRKIVLGDDLDIDFLIFGWPQIMIDGNGKNIFTHVFPWIFGLSLVIQNATLHVDGNGEKLFGDMFPFSIFALQLLTDDVVLIPTNSLVDTALFYGIIMLMANNFTIRGYGNQVRLGYSLFSEGNFLGYLDGFALLKNSTLRIEQNTTVEMNDGVLMWPVDETSVLYLDGCDLYSGPYGFFMPGGTVVFDNEVGLHAREIGGVLDPEIVMQFGDQGNLTNMIYTENAVVKYDGTVIVNAIP